MKKIAVTLLSLGLTLTACFAMAGCGGPKEPDPVPPPADAYLCENDPHVQKVGSKLYYINDDGERETGVFAFYDYNAYYFNKGTTAGVQITMKWISSHILMCEIAHSSTFIVWGDDSALVIDTGFGIGNTREFVEMVLGDTPYEVALTHTDPDHVGGVCSFEGVTKVWTTAAGDAEKTSTNSDGAPARWSVENRAKDIINSDNPYVVEDLCPVTDTFTFDIFENGYEFHLGGYDVEVMTIPGHSQGFAMFLFKQDRLLLVGDSGTHQTIISEVVETYCNRLKEINTRNDEWDYFFTSHDGNELFEKTAIDHLIKACENVMEKYPENSEVDSSNTSSVSGWGISYHMSKIWEVKEENE